MVCMALIALITLLSAECVLCDQIWANCTLVKIKLTPPVDSFITLLATSADPQTSQGWFLIHRCLFWEA